MLKDMVVFIEEEPGQRERLAYAAALAEQRQAHLIATFVPAMLGDDRYAGFAIGRALTEMLHQHRDEIDRARERAREAFAQIVANRGFTHEWRVAEQEAGESLMLHARHVDLAIVGPPSRDDRPATALSLSEDMIFASGRPTLLLPRVWPTTRLPKRVVLGWNGSREAARAIADAMPILVAAESVHLVVVPEPGIDHLLGADPGADIARHLARHGVPVVLEQVRGEDAGLVLIERCAGLEADLLVIGAYGRSKISEFVFGGVTRTMLTQVPLPIMLSR